MVELLKQIWGFIKLPSTLILATVMVFATILGASAMTIDTIEDSYTVSSGDSIKGSMIIEGFVPTITAKTDHPWISFSEDRLITEITVVGNPITNGVVSLDYFINVPDDADIGIYRGLIELTEGSDTDYLNVKISVQNGFIGGISRSLEHPRGVYLTYVFIGGFLFILLLYFYMRSSK